MKHFILSVVCAVVLVGGVFFVGGCEESESSGSKQARLVAAKNLELEKQVQTLEEDVAKQEGLVAQCEKEKVELAQKAAQIEPNLQLIFGEMAQKMQTVEAENAQLKEELAKLEQRLTE